MLSPADYNRAAEALGCDVAAIRAVDRVESAGSGFLPNGQPKILFEAHIFGRLTGSEFHRSHPHISSPTWGKSLYKGGAAEHDRLAEAVALDRTAALMSTSWGRFQILGSNWRECGFPNLQAFVNAMYASEGAQLDAFVAFVQRRGLADELQRHDWAGFARGYNGPAYKNNRYDQKLAQAFDTFKRAEAA